MTTMSGHSRFEFEVLGPVLIRRRGATVPLGAAMLRRLLATLLCRAGRPVAVDTLMAVLWGGAPPRSAHKTLQVYIRRLRKALGEDDRIRYGPAGYTAAVTGAELDALRFEEFAASARRAGGRADLESAAELLERALGLWRGTAYHDVGEVPVVSDEARRLEEMRLQAHEDLAAVQIVRGRYAGLIANLAELAALHPYRERLHACLMLALCQAGRQVEALELYQRARAVLREELGLEPGRTLRLAHEAVLRGDAVAAAAAELLGPSYLQGSPVDRPARPPAPSGDVAGTDGGAGPIGPPPGTARREDLPPWPDDQAVPGRPEPRAEAAAGQASGQEPDRVTDRVTDRAAHGVIAASGPQERTPTTESAHPEAPPGDLPPAPDAPVTPRTAVPTAPAPAPTTVPTAVPTTVPAAVLDPRTVVPFHLPPDIADFTGRQELVESLGRRLMQARDSPLVTIVALDGMPGIGKTALAVRVAHGLRDIFHDGQLYIDLHEADARPLDHGEALARFLVALGVSGQELPPTPEERGRLFRAVLARRRVLVVLDNAACEEQVRNLLPGCPGSAVLVTSRRRLAGLSAHFVRLGPLDPMAARALLARVAGPRAAADPSTAAEIVRLCDHLPLAIRIAGAKLALREHWTLAHLAARLREERRRLDELVVGDLSVRASLAGSYALLDATAKRALRLLGPLDVPDFTARDLAAVLGTPVGEAEICADLLVDAQLLMCDGVDGRGRLRYRFPSLVRLYARERAEAEDGPARRHDERGRIVRVLGATRTTRISW